MPFQINATDPPAGGNPVGLGYRYVLPEARGVDGEGYPCGAVGYPSVVIKFERITGTVWDWYKDFTGDDPYVTLSSLQVWDPFSGTPQWVTFSASAVMHRPTYGNISGGDYLDVEVKFTRLS